MPDPQFSGDFVNNEWVFPAVDMQDLFLLSTGIQNPNINTSPLGLPCFAARTNLVWPSNDFGHLRWGRGRVALTPNAALAPDGTMSAWRITDAAGTGWHGVYNLCSVAAGQVYTETWHVKADTTSKGRIWYINGNDGGYADFDLAANTIVKSASMADCDLIEKDDGWFDVVLTGVCNSSTSYVQIDVNNEAGANSYAGNGTRSLYIWEADLQRGSTPGPFLPTTTGVVTRNYDYVRTLPEVTAMTKVIKAKTAKMIPPNGEAQVLWHVDNLSEANDLEAWRDWNGHIIAEIHQANNSIRKLDLGFVANDTDFKIAVSASAATGLIASMNGQPAISGAALPWPTGMISEKLGTNAWMMNPPYPYPTRYWGSTIEFEATYSEALSGPELEILSAL